MSGESQSSRDYVLGHSDEEQYRLQKQAELWHYASSRLCPRAQETRCTAAGS